MPSRSSQSPFFTKLPPELRLEVYRHAFIQYTPLSQFDALSAIKTLHTCRQFHDEAAPIFYNNDVNVFSVNLSKYPSRLPQPIPMIFMDKNLAPSIKHLAIQQLSPPRRWDRVRNRYSPRYSFPKAMMGNLRSLSSITFRATFLWRGDIPPTTSLGSRNWS
jgi:hypothetical protein